GLLNDLQVANGPRLRTEPATGLNISRQNFALYGGALTIGQKHLQLLRRTDHWYCFLSWHTAAINRRVQSEPVVRMRTHGDDVTGFSNWPRSEEHTSELQSLA